MRKFLVVLEQREGVVLSRSAEVWKDAQRIACECGDAEVVGVVAVPAGINGLESQLEGNGRLFVVEDERFASPRPDLLLDAVEGVLLKVDAECVFMLHSSSGADLGPELAVRLEAGLASDALDLRMEDGEIVADALLYAGGVRGRYRLETLRKIFTLRPGSGAGAGGSFEGNPIVEAVSLPEQPGVSGMLGVLVEELVAHGEAGDIGEAEIILAGGRGMGGPEGFSMLESIAVLLGGRVGASRSAVDEGWRPHAEQIGQTGRTVAPRLYIACGISGAVQHLAGIGGAGTIVALNSDPDAPIFAAADYGLVGDVHEVLPRLQDLLEERMGKK